jgi:hypothetical protein
MKRCMENLHATSDQYSIISAVILAWMKINRARHPVLDRRYDDSDRLHTEPNGLR